jgi:hypothetical protein
MKLAGELVVARNRLVELARASTDPELGQLGERISRLVGAVQSEVLEARLTPVREVFDRFPRVVRDLARDLGRQVRLEVEGGDIELDRAVLDEGRRSAGAPGTKRDRSRDRAAARPGQGGKAGRGAAPAVSVAGTE